MRSAEITRTTTETSITLSLTLEGTGRYDIHTGVGFLDHMLELFTRHGRFDLTLRCEGDTQVDDHHSVEDVGIALGDAFRQALGGKAGIVRYGSFLLPMDEALVLVALDLSGRPHLAFDAAIPTEKIGTFDCELVEEFFLGLTRAMGCTLHIKQLAGSNSHHIVEAMFKGCGRALRQAVAADPRAEGEIPSTKGLL